MAEQAKRKGPHAADTGRFSALHAGGFYPLGSPRHAGAVGRNANRSKHGLSIQRGEKLLR